MSLSLTYNNPTEEEMKAINKMKDAMKDCGYTKIKGVDYIFCNLAEIPATSVRGTDIIFELKEIESNGERLNVSVPKQKVNNNIPYAIRHEVSDGGPIKFDALKQKEQFLASIKKVEEGTQELKKIRTEKLMKKANRLRVLANPSRQPLKTEHNDNKDTPSEAHLFYTVDAEEELERIMASIETRIIERNQNKNKVQVTYPANVDVNVEIYESGDLKINIKNKED